MSQGASASNVTSFFNAARDEINSHPDLYDNGGFRAFELWRNGEKRAIIFGTFHIPNARTTYLPDKVYTAFNASDRILIETDISRVSPVRIKQFRSEVDDVLTRKGSKEYVELTDRAANGELYSFASAMGISADQLNHVSLLGIERIILNKYCSDTIQMYNLGGQPIDIILNSWAVFLNKDISEMEQIEAYIQLLSDPNPSTSVNIIPLLLKRNLTRSALINFQLENYAGGHIDLAFASERAYLASKEERDAMVARYENFIVGRNSSFVERIEQTIGKEGLQFIAVGAEHLLGSAGLVNMLRQRGWDVKPVYPNGESR